MNWLQSLFFNNNDEPMKISRIEIEGDFEFYQDDETLKIRTVGGTPPSEFVQIQLYGDIMRFYKEPESADVINFEYWKGDPVIIDARIINDTWGFAPTQTMRKANGNYKEVPTDWNRVGWDGCYFKLPDTVEPPPAEPPPPTTDERVLIVPGDAVYRQIPHDWESPDWDYKIRQKELDYKKFPPDSALPETVKLGGMNKNKWYPLTKEWQFFIYDLVKKFAPDMDDAGVLAAYASLVEDHRAFTDHHYEGYTDHVLGKDLDSPKGNYQWKYTLSTGGNLVKQLVDNGSEIIIEALDVTKPPPPVDEVWNKPHLIHMATQITVEELADGTYKVVHFPQVRDKDNQKTGTPIPLLGIGGTNVIEKNKTKILTAGSEYRIANLRKWKT